MFGGSAHVRVERGSGARRAKAGRQLCARASRAGLLAAGARRVDAEAVAEADRSGPRLCGRDDVLTSHSLLFGCSLRLREPLEQERVWRNSVSFADLEFGVAKNVAVVFDRDAALGPAALHIELTLELNTAE